MTKCYLGGGDEEEYEGDEREKEADARLYVHAISLTRLRDKNSETLRGDIAGPASISVEMHTSVQF